MNFLILDEPTNHLDMRTKDILKSAIQAFDGTVIVVSHDRDFLNNLVDKVYEFGGGRVREHLCGIYEFLQSKRIDSLQELERKETSVVIPAEPKEMTDSKLSYLEQKERERVLRQARKKVEQAEQLIADTEKELERLENTLAAGGDIDPTLYTRHAELQDALDQAMEQWEQASAALDDLTTKE